MLHAQRRSNKYKFYSLWLDHSETRGEHANHYTIDVVYKSKYIMYKSSRLALCVLYSNAAQPVICEGRHLIHMRKTLTLSHHITKMGGLEL